ncbi:MAG: AraC family transcriptional regulator [Muribaculaceae bacterium]|nr:AraC family transcriptional regulator [Muribaculaceae bacterium]
MRIKSGFKGERSLVLPKVILDIMDKDPLSQILHVTDIGYYPKARHHYRRRETPIDQYIFIYCIEGRGWYEIDGIRYDVEENQYFILPAGMPHTYAASEDSPWTIYWAHFRGSYAKYFVASDHNPQTIAPSMDSGIFNRINLFEEVLNTLNDSFAIENIRYAVSLFHHFLESIRYFRLYRKVGNTKHDSDVVECTLHFLNENMEKHITLGEIADYSGFSSSYLSAMFKKRTGCSPLTYLNILKIKRACELIDNTDMKINQISYKLGFNDPFYFSRLFTKIMGKSPTQYKHTPKV